MKLNKLIVIVFLLGITSTIKAQDFTLNNVDDFKKAIAKSTTEDKLLLIITINDHPELDQFQNGKFLKDNYLIDTAINNKLKEHLVSFLVDLNTEIGKRFAKSMASRIHPYLSYSYFFNTKYNVMLTVKETNSNITKQRYLELIDKAINLKKWVNKLINDDYSELSGNDATKIYNKIKHYNIDGSEVTVASIASLIITQLKPNYLWDKDHKTTISEGVFNDIDNSNFQYLLANREKFIEVFNKFNWEIFLSNNASAFLNKAIVTKDKELLNRVLNEVADKTTNTEDIAYKRYSYKIDFEFKVNGEASGNKVLKELFNDSEVKAYHKESMIDHYLKLGDRNKERLDLYIAYYDNLETNYAKKIVEKYFRLKSLYTSIGNSTKAEQSMDSLVSIISNSNDSELRFDIIKGIYEQKSKNTNLLKACIPILESIIQEGCDNYEGASIVCAARADSSKRLIEHFNSLLKN